MMQAYYLPETEYVHWARTHPVRWVSIWFINARKKSRLVNSLFIIKACESVCLVGIYEKSNHRVDQSRCHDERMEKKNKVGSARKDGGSWTLASASVVRFRGYSSSKFCTSSFLPIYMSYVNCVSLSYWYRDRVYNWYRDRVVYLLVSDCNIISILQGHIKCNFGSHHRGNNEFTGAELKEFLFPVSSWKISWTSFSIVFAS